jgi:hypothetical protein
VPPARMASRTQKYRCRVRFLIRERKCTAR